jgi:heme exporter protein D
MDGIGCVVFTDYISHSSMTCLPVCLSACLSVWIVRKKKKKKKRKKKREMRLSEVVR